MIIFTRPKSDQHGQCQLNQLYWALVGLRLSVLLRIREDKHNVHIFCDTSDDKKAFNFGAEMSKISSTIDRVLEQDISVSQLSEFLSNNEV